MSVIIPCRDEARFIGDCLDSVMATEYPHDRLEVIVVDGMSEDGTRAILERYAATPGVIRVEDNPSRTTAGALNRGITSARGDIVIRLDAHSIYPRDYVGRSVAILEASGADCVGGVWVTTVRDGGWRAAGIKLSLTHWLGVGNATFRLGAREPQWVDAVPYGCFRRSVFVRFGLYNEALDRSQDFDLWSRIRQGGARILLHPEITSTYRARGRFGELWRYNFGNGYWVTWPMRLVGTRFSVRHVIPLAFMSVLLATAAGGIVFRPVWWVTTVTMLAYLIAVLAVSTYAAARDRDPSLLLSGPIAFAGLHFSYGLGSLWGAIKPIRGADRQQARVVAHLPLGGSR